MKAYIDTKKTYKTNGYQIDTGSKRRLNRKLRFLFDKYGYDIEECDLVSEK